MTLAALQVGYRDAVTHLVDDDSLEDSDVVTNNAMNRDRHLSGRDGYAHELRFDPSSGSSSDGPNRVGPNDWK